RRYPHSGKPRTCHLSCPERMPSQATTAGVSGFQALVDEFLTEEFEARPVAAGDLGLSDYDDRLDDLSAAALRRRDEDATRWRARLSRGSPTSRRSWPMRSSSAAGPGRHGAAFGTCELLPLELAAGPDRDRLVDAGARAADALERWIAHLEELAKRATGTWQLGEERYSRLLREREALPYDARQLREIGRQEYDRLDAEMREIARGIDGNGDWARALAEANADHPPTEEAMRGGYEAWTERARRFLTDTGLVTLPAGEICLVEPSPIFQRPVLGVASYAAPPAFSSSVLGHFFVPFAPDGTPDAEV